MDKCEHIQKCTKCGKLLCNYCVEICSGCPLEGCEPCFTQHLETCEECNALLCPQEIVTFTKEGNKDLKICPACSAQKEMN